VRIQLIAFSVFPGGLVTLFGIVLMLCVIVMYALYRKGDVRVHFSRGKTSFELDAKERSLK
jgi:hypothetical protein